MKKFFVLLLVVVISLSSCGKIQYVCDYDNVISVQIVRLDGVDSRVYLYTTIGEIENIEQFFSRFKTIEQKPRSFGDPPGTEFGDLVIRFGYGNGNADYVSVRKQYLERMEKNRLYYDRFDEEQFNLLISECFDNMETHKFYLMHSNVNVSSIQIVNTHYYVKDGVEEVVHETLGEVGDIENFLSRINALDYHCSNPGNYIDVHDRTNKEAAVKITYENGDYEIFSHNRREAFHVQSDDPYDENVYIGTFDSEQFYSLLFEYTEN